MFGSLNLTQTLKEVHGRNVNEIQSSYRNSILLTLMLVNIRLKLILSIIVLVIFFKKILIFIILMSMNIKLEYLFLKKSGGCATQDIGLL
jgi:hypothetical protein